MPTDPKILGLAVLAGFAPALVWLWFWLRENKEKPEPRGVLLMCFIFGMVAVIFVVPVEKFIQAHVSGDVAQITGWAGVEELIKYLAVLLILGRTALIEEPIDWPIYLITAALGFAALENTFFLLKPLSLDGTTIGLLSNIHSQFSILTQLRFLGSTLLHAVSSGLVGIALGLAFYAGTFTKKFSLIVGLACAITLHSAFNFFIIGSSGNNFLKVFGFLWVVTIINMLLLEKLRRMSGEN